MSQLCSLLRCVLRQRQKSQGVCLDGEITARPQLAGVDTVASGSSLHSWSCPQGALGRGPEASSLQTLNISTPEEWPLKDGLTFRVSELSHVTTPGDVTQNFLRQGAVTQGEITLRE